MTLHNAKGLEYDTVFIIGCEDGVFPHSRSLEEGGHEEERRLCYVGITRADARLYLTYARGRQLFGRSERTCPRASSARSRRAGRAPLDRGAHGMTWGSTQSAARLAASAARFGAPAPGRPRRRSRSTRPGAGAAVGDDVVHASFGDGVVTAVEPGSVVVVRFAADGNERKLMADYAPIKKAVTMAARVDRRQGGRGGGPRAGRRSPRGCRGGAGRAPGLATVLVGDDPASDVYVGNKLKACAEAGIRSIHHELPADVVRRRSSRRWSQELNADDAVDGILVQLPLPDHLDPDRIVALIYPAKDVDGLTPLERRPARPGGDAGPRSPCTPRRRDGAARATRGSSSRAPQRSWSGRSNLVGGPLARLLLLAPTRR